MMAVTEKDLLRFFDFLEGASPVVLVAGSKWAASYSVGMLFGQSVAGWMENNPELARSAFNDFRAYEAATGEVRGR
jgi:hypothetical protein